MNEYKNEEMNTGVGNIFKRYYFTILYTVWFKVEYYQLYRCYSSNMCQCHAID